MFRFIDTDVRSHTLMTDNVLYLRYQRELEIRFLPQCISNLRWYFKEAIDAHEMIRPKLPNHIDFEANMATVDGEIMMDWLRENCKGEVRYEEDIEYEVPATRPAQFISSRLRIGLLNPKDAMLFKLRFG